MRKKIAGFVLVAALGVGAGPLLNAATANNTPSTTDPVLCFVAAQAIITEALHEFREGHLTAAELRSVLVGTASFLGDCLTPST